MVVGGQHFYRNRRSGLLSKQKTCLAQTPECYAVVMCCFAEKESKTTDCSDLDLDSIFLLQEAELLQLKNDADMCIRHAVIIKQ